MARSKKEKAEKPRLKPKQELFCQLYATEREFFGNGVQSYIEAYDIIVGHGEGESTHDTCRAVASEMLTNPNILARIDELLELGPLSTQKADKTLGFWMTQRAHPDTSMSAVKEYNKLKGRIIDKTKIITETFTIDDIRSLLAPLPQERQDKIYATLTNALAEAELLRSSAQSTSSNPQ
jgi:hypothetical protein